MALDHAWSNSSGAEERVARRCGGCGYGVSCATVPARCPMCGGMAWERAPQYRLPEDRRWAPALGTQQASLESRSIR